MSIPVDLSQLAEALARYRYAYLMTSPAEGAPHAVAVYAKVAGDELTIDGAGRRTRTHAHERPAVALVWPPAEEGGYSLIVDGQARLEGAQLRIRPTRAVLHRAAPAPQARADGACTADCLELDLKPCTPHP